MHIIIALTFNKLMNETLSKPIPPADDDCCGGGACNPCVWDGYYEKLQQWRIQQSAIKEQQAKEA